MQKIARGVSLMRHPLLSLFIPTLGRGNISVLSIARRLFFEFIRRFMSWKAEKQALVLFPTSNGFEFIQNRYSLDTRLKS